MIPMTIPWLSLIVTAVLLSHMILRKIGMQNFVDISGTCQIMSQSRLILLTGGRYVLFHFLLYSITNFKIGKCKILSDTCPYRSQRFTKPSFCCPLRATILKCKTYCHRSPFASQCLNLRSITNHESYLP